MTEQVANNPQLVKGVVIVGAIVVVGVGGYMAFSGNGLADIIGMGVSGTIQGIVAGVKEVYYQLDPENKLGKFGTDLANASYTRGAGKIPKNLGSCPAGWQKDAGLCYPRCASNYKGVGPVCWKKQFHSGISKDNPTGAAKNKSPLEKANDKIS